jgi:hypothetical protein
MPSRPSSITSPTSWNPLCRKFRSTSDKSPNVCHPDWFWVPRPRSSSTSSSIGLSKRRSCSLKLPLLTLRKRRLKRMTSF